MSQATSARAAARPFALVVTFAVSVLVAAACTPADRANGEACIKNEDCLSRICSQMVCVAAPTLLDAQVNGEAGPSLDGGDAAADATTADTGSPPVDSGKADVASDAPTDSPAEASEAGDDGASDTGVTDAGTDAATD